MDPHFAALPDPRVWAVCWRRSRVCSLKPSLISTENRVGAQGAMVRSPVVMRLTGEELVVGVNSRVGLLGYVVLCCIVCYSCYPYSVTLVAHDMATHRRGQGGGQRPRPARGAGGRSHGRGRLSLYTDYTESARGPDERGSPSPLWRSIQSTSAKSAHAAAAPLSLPITSPGDLAHRSGDGFHASVRDVGARRLRPCRLGEQQPPMRRQPAQVPPCWAPSRLFPQG